MHSPASASLLLILCAVASFISCGADGGRHIKMASLYAPQLTRWRALVGGVVRDCVEHERKVLLVSREDCLVAGEEEDEDRRDCLEIGGRLFPLVDETKVAVHGGGRVRCVECSSPAHGVEPMLLTVTEGKEVAEVIAPGPDGVLRVVGCGCCADPETGTVQHAVDVQGGLEAFILLVSVREELGRIVCIKRIN
ncbi:hypothetical protein E2562_011012 [Oryza meyeriana var. granulata]|uniref:Uncharacterized protein n=1 Tax=Oryza meyeriana var. granulata TaxID=110450 RepID=A0A6G1BWU2_9ORYZ|nr:hypothetical protein E2562_011012 [Oryza meyeriana var. granulata]